MECSYKFKFYINARHSVNLGGNQSDIHRSKITKLYKLY